MTKAASAPPCAPPPSPLPKPPPSPPSGSVGLGVGMAVTMDRVLVLVVVVEGGSLSKMKYRVVWLTGGSTIISVIAVTSGSEPPPIAGSLEVSVGVSAR